MDPQKRKDEDYDSKSEHYTYKFALKILPFIVRNLLYQSFVQAEVKTLCHTINGAVLSKCGVLGNG